MALQSALTGGQLTEIRSGEYQTLQFVCLVPNTVVVRFQPSVAPSTSVFAQITVGTVNTGSMSNIKEGQLVIFSTSTDHQATEFFRTRVRKVSGTTILYVGENSQTLTTSHYVTVVDTYEIQEKLRRDLNRLDWEITFRLLRPIETALQSAYVLTNGVTAFTPTASPRVMDADASSISTHSWSSSNSSDVLNSGGTTASPNFTLQAGAFRWIRYTFTDNLGLSNYRVIPVWTVPKNYSNVVALGWGAASGELANVSFDSELGWTCSIPAFSGISTLLNRTFTVVACDEWYGGRTNADRQSIRTNINFIGYLQTESVQTSADEQHGQISETQFRIESFGHQLERQNISPVTVIQTINTATVWDEIQDPTPGRMLTYRLTEYSTASNLMAIALPSDDGNFIGDDLTLSTEKALDDLIQIASNINAEIQFDITGKLEMCRDLNYLNTTARDAAPVVATLTPADFTSQYTIDYEYGFTTSQVTITGGDYTTSTDRYDLTEAVAPAVARYGEGDPFELPNQVLTTNSTQAQANTELAQRAANFLAANNPTWTLRVTLKDQWHFLIPDVGAWFKFTITAEDTVRGKVFGSSDRWQLVQIDVTTNSELGTREVTAIFRHETSSTGASVRAAPIVHDEQADIDYVPGVLPPFTGGDTTLTDDTWYDSQDPRPPSNQNPVQPDCELFGFRPKSVDSMFTGSLGTLYATVTVRGSGLISTGAGAVDIDFESTNGGLTADYDVSGTPGNQYIGVYTGGVGWEDSLDQTLTGPNRSVRGIAIRYIPGADLTDPAVELDYSTVFGTNYLNSCYGARIICKNNGATVRDSGTGIGQGTGTLSDSATGTVDEIILLAICGVSSSQSIDPGGTSTFTGFRIAGVGQVWGDALYYSTDEWQTAQAYNANNGLYLEGSQPTAPPFNPNHEYILPSIQITGLATVQIEFRHTSYPQANMENWSLGGVVCEQEDPI